MVIIIGILIGLNGGITLSLSHSAVRAIGDLQVNWGVPEGVHFFSVSNMKPGDMVTKDIEIFKGGGIRPWHDPETNSKKGGKGKIAYQK